MYVLSSNYHFPFISNSYNIIGTNPEVAAFNRTDKNDSSEWRSETPTVDISF
jgi:hypothetical protein